jgi:hypothetical protein
MTSFTSNPSPQLRTVSRKGVLELAASFGLIAGLGAAPAATATRGGVVGAWSLVSFDVDEGKGVVKPRFGPNPAGYLIYSADARMAVVLAGTHRPELSRHPPRPRPKVCAPKRCKTFWPMPDATKSEATAYSITLK